MYTNFVAVTHIAYGLSLKERARTRSQFVVPLCQKIFFQFTSPTTTNTTRSNTGKLSGGWRLLENRRHVMGQGVRLRSSVVTSSRTRGPELGRQPRVESTSRHLTSAGRRFGRRCSSRALPVTACRSAHRARRRPEQRTLSAPLAIVGGDQLSLLSTWAIAPTFSRACQLTPVPATDFPPFS